MSRTREQLLAEIARLLDESPEAAVAREKAAFARELQGTDGSVVLCGAGRLGRLCARALLRGGVPLRAFCDRNPDLGGATVEGVPVVTPEEAVRRHGGSALFVVAIWTGTAGESMAQRLERLRAAGASHVSTFASLGWAHGREETPFHAFELPSQTLAAAPAWRDLAHALDDELSLRTLRDALRQRLRGEFSSAPPVADQYFPTDVIRLGRRETFVDGGAFTGDTLADFCRRTAGEFEAYHAFEPDPRNLEILARARERLPVAMRARVFIHPVALHDQSGEIGFEFAGATTSRVVAESPRLSQARRLDEVLGEVGITFLKLDVEGAEDAALRGAESSLRRHRPTVAACVYHRPEDLWQIPLALRAWLGECRLHLRQHAFDGWETVAYVVPVNAAGRDGRGGAR